MHQYLHIIFEKGKEHIVLLLIVLGVAVRVVGFPNVPYGLHQDEINVAYESYLLVHEGIDRHGNPFPVNLSVWGDGNPILGPVLQMPFMYFLGITQFSVRLPYLIIGCLTLLIFYLFLREICDKNIAIIGLFLMAISPWHISISRWALDANLLSPTILLGAYWLAIWIRKGSWYIAGGMAAFAISLYAYPPALIIIPLLLVLIIFSLLRNKKYSHLHFITAFLLFGILATPIVLYVLMNTKIINLDTINLKLFSIPRLTQTPRLLTESIFLKESWIVSAMKNFRVFLRLMLTQDDGVLLNALPRFGMIYGVGIIFSLYGLCISIRRLIKTPQSPILIPLSWLLACIISTLFLYSNVHRINAIVIPLITFAAIGIAQLLKRPLPFRLVIIYFTLWFIAFLHAYFFIYTDPSQGISQYDLFHAIEYTTNRVPSGAICLTNKVNNTYVFALASAELPGTAFRNAIKKNGQIIRIDRFVFGLDSCNPVTEGYVMTTSEFRSFRPKGIPLEKHKFGNFIALIPAR